MISGTVFNDVNTDSKQDSDDLVITTGVTVNLINATGDIVATKTTDSNGDYEFTNLTP